MKKIVILASTCTYWLFQAWQLNDKTSVLHGVPVNTPYGISSSILAPLSVGARVVMIPNNDPVKAWALMLGLGYGIDKAKYPRTSVDVVCASPAQYQMMLNRYDDLFSVRTYAVVATPI